MKLDKPLESGQESDIFPLMVQLTWAQKFNVEHVKAAEKITRIYNHIGAKLTREQQKEFIALADGHNFALDEQTAKDPARHEIYRAVSVEGVLTRRLLTTTRYIWLWSLYGMHPLLAYFRKRCKRNGLVPDFPLLPDDEFHGCPGEVLDQIREMRSRLEADRLQLDRIEALFLAGVNEFNELEGQPRMHRLIFTERCMDVFFNVWRVNNGVMG